MTNETRLRSLEQELPLLLKDVPSAPTEELTRFHTTSEMITTLRPQEPVHCYRPRVIEQAAKWFVQEFPGQVMYSVKSNPDVHILRWLSRAGVKHFDVASLPEVKLVAEHFPHSKMYFMHPVKSREAITEAYHTYGVRAFVIDSQDELDKILACTGYAPDLDLYVRLSLPGDKVGYSLAGKFGIAPEKAKDLLKAARDVSRKLGICFHVGSQCMDPAAYTNALAAVKKLVKRARVKLDIIDVGGGFPSIYPGMTPPALDSYMDAIRAGLDDLMEGQKMDVFCEPGRALVAEGGSVVVRVELRKGDALYINDGTYGALFDAGHPKFQYPVRAFRLGGKLSKTTMPFKFFGPTCDSLDAMEGPFHLPADIAEGDWIEIGQLGAYGATMRTRFNGFYSERNVQVADKPMLSLFGKK